MERLDLPAIKAGLDEIGEYTGAPEALLPFKMACSFYEQQLKLWGPLVTTVESIRECLMFVAAAMDLVRYYRCVRNTRGLRALSKHFELLRPAFFGVAGTYTVQQSKGSIFRKILGEQGYEIPTDEKAKDSVRKSVELMLALAAMNTFEQVAVEDPDDSGRAAPNPDIIIDYDDHRYGIACKSLSSPNEENFKKRIAEGLGQIDCAIEAGKVDRRRGIVLIDISALLEHERLFVPANGQLWDLRGTGQILLSAMQEAMAKVFGSSLRTYAEILAGPFKGHDLPVGILLYGHALMICQESHGAIVPIYQKGLIQGFGNDVSSILAFCKGLNNAIHCQRSDR